MFLERLTLIRLLQVLKHTPPVRVLQKWSLSVGIWKVNTQRFTVVTWNAKKRRKVPEELGFRWYFRICFFLCRHTFSGPTFLFLSRSLGLGLGLLFSLSVSYLLCLSLPSTHLSVSKLLFYSFLLSFFCFCKSRDVEDGTRQGLVILESWKSLRVKRCWLLNEKVNHRFRIAVSK